MPDLGTRTSIYQPEQPGRIFPEEPKFNSPEELRMDRKKRLVAACHAFAEHGLDYGFAGHLTVRDPEHPELYWTNPMAVHFAQVSMSNLILVDHDGMVIEGDYAVNRAGFVLHAAIHAAHPDILAMCHAHSIYGTAFAALGRPLEPITQDACAFFEDHAVVLEEAGQVAVEADAGANFAKAFTGVKAAIHQNHGLLTASRHSIDSAAFWFIAISQFISRKTAPAIAANMSAVNISAGCTSNPFTKTSWPRNRKCSTDPAGHSLRRHKCVAALLVWPRWARLLKVNPARRWSSD